MMLVILCVSVEDYQLSPEKYMVRGTAEEPLIR